MSKYLNFTIQNIDIIKEDSDSQFAHAKIQVFSSGANEHDMFCSEETLRETASTIYDKPLLYNFDSPLGDYDFGTHTTPDKSLICGFVVPNSESFVKLEDSRIALIVDCRIWKIYAPRVVEIFKQDGGEKSVSVEMELYDSNKRSDGLLDMISFSYTGVCLLGQNVVPASPGANIQMVSFAEENEKYLEAYWKEFANKEMSNFPRRGDNKVVSLSNSKFQQFDYDFARTIKEDFPEIWKKSGNMRGNESFEFWAKARDGSGGRSILEWIKNRETWAARHKYNKNLSGVVAAVKWGVVVQKGEKYMKDLINSEKKEIMSYFDDGELLTFPYENKNDMNPALKGIDPPITVAQGNEIARQADAIGSDDKKNGWAIAISSFKKTHKVKNGKWVKASESDKKEEMSVSEEEEEKNKMAVEEKDKEEMAADEETNEEETQEESGEKEEETENKNMSLDVNLDVAAALKFLEEETEVYEKMVYEFSDVGEKDLSKLAYALYCRGMAMQEKHAQMSFEMNSVTEKMAKMEEEAKAYMSELDNLREFKSEKDKEEFTFSVNKVLNQISTKVEIPSEELDELRKDSENYSLSDLNIWINGAKAKALDFSMKKTKDEEDGGINKFALPVKPSENKRSPKGLWIK